MKLQIKYITSALKINVMELNILHTKIDETDGMSKANEVHKVSGEAREIMLNVKHGGSSRGLFLLIIGEENTRVQ